MRFVVSIFLAFSSTVHELCVRTKLVLLSTWGQWKQVVNLNTDIPLSSYCELVSKRAAEIFFLLLLKFSSYCSNVEVYLSVHNGITVECGYKYNRDHL